MGGGVLEKAGLAEGLQVGITGSQGREGGERAGRARADSKRALGRRFGNTSVQAASLWLKKKMSRYGQDRRSPPVSWPPRSRAALIKAWERGGLCFGRIHRPAEVCLSSLRTNSFGSKAPYKDHRKETSA